MTSLSISSNKPQPSGNAANALQGNATADSIATDAQSAAPFAFLLAQQIGESALPIPDMAQAAIAIDSTAADGTDRALKDKQDPTAATTNIPGDPANMLAAILQQLPAPEDRVPKTDGMQAISSFAQGSSQGIGYKIPAAGLENRQIIQMPAIDSLPSEAIQRAESLPGLAQSATNAAQTMMPGMLTDNISAAPSPTISTPLGNKGWADEFSQKISWMSTQQNQVAELHLNPPNLGPLDVVLKISDNQATVLFASPHGAVRDAVENALPNLREILADNGIMLGNTTISDQSPRDRSMNEFMNQDSGAAARHEIFGIASEPAGSMPTAVQNVSVRRHNGMVDTFA